MTETSETESNCVTNIVHDLWTSNDEGKERNHVVSHKEKEKRDESWTMKEKLVEEEKPNMEVIKKERKENPTLKENNFVLENYYKDRLPRMRKID